MPNPLHRYRRLVTGLAGASVETAERLLRVVVKESDVAADRIEQVVNDVLAASGRGSVALAEAVRTEAELLLRRVDPDARLDLDYVEDRLITLARVLLVEEEDRRPAGQEPPEPEEER